MSCMNPSLGYSLQTIRGVPLNPTFDSALYCYLLDNFETNNGDTFVVTFIKARTSWTQMMVHLILHDGEPGGFQNVTMPWVEAFSSDVLSGLENSSWTIEGINNTRGPRCFKSHATVDHLPRGLADIKVIYVARNPKDTVVNLYLNAKTLPEYGFTGEFDDFCALFLEGKVENGSWFDHVLDWYRECQSDPEYFIFLMYEEIYENSVLAVQLLANLLERPCSDEMCSKIVLQLQQQEKENEKEYSLLQNNLENRKIKHRAGGVGEWRDYFTVAQSEAFDKVYLSKMKDSGLRFNFGPNAQGNEVYM